MRKNYEGHIAELESTLGSEEAALAEATALLQRTKEEYERKVCDIASRDFGSTLYS